MAVAEHSPLSYYRGLSLRKLGHHTYAITLFRGLLRFAERRIGREAQIVLFATSLPNLIVFVEYLQRSDATQSIGSSSRWHTTVLGMEKPRER